MAFSPAFLDELNARNPIEDVVGQYVALTKRGNNLFGLCPFHSEKTPSFSVAPDKGIYYCFGCHKGGGAVNFIMEIENLSYPDAIRFLAKRAGMEVPEDDEYQSQFRKKSAYGRCAGTLHAFSMRSSRRRRRPRPESTLPSAACPTARSRALASALHRIAGRR